jgi:hypothetical protein
MCASSALPVRHAISASKAMKLAIMASATTTPLRSNAAPRNRGHAYAR